MGLEIIAQIEQGFLENLFFTQQKRDEKPAHSPISVEKRMDGFKLGVCQTAMDQYR